MVFIPTAATNPRQKNRFRVDIDGLEAAYVYSVRLPVPRVTEKQYRGGGEVCPTKWPVGVEFSDMELSKILPADSLDYWAWAWLTKVVDLETQRIGVSSEYKMDLEIHDINFLSIPIHTWYIAGAWPKAIEYSDSDAESVEKKIQRLTIACDFCREV
jgi:phage tail-like protein